MSAAVGTMSSITKDVSLDPHLDEELKVKNNVSYEEPNQVAYSDGGGNSSNAEETDEAEEEEDDESKLESDRELDLGPQFSLKEQLDKDKDDESLRKWKEQLLGASVDMSIVGEIKEPEVKVQSLTISCPDRPDLTLPIPLTNDPKKSLFILKEGTKCQMKFTFTVSKNIVSGLKYTNVVWKTGVRVDSRKRMLGTYSPQQEPYTYALEEEAIPSGMFARGTYAARTKFVDDDQKCYLDFSYYFEIQKKWQ